MCYTITGSGKKLLITSSRFFPSSVEPPPLRRVFPYVTFNKLSELGSIVQDILLLVVSPAEGKRRLNNEFMVI